MRYPHLLVGMACPSAICLLTAAALSALPNLASAATETYQVNASADDVFCSATGVWQYNAVTYWPWEGGDRRTYLRWEIDVPAGAEITSANVIVQAAGNYSGTSNVVLHGIAEDDCANFASTPWNRPVGSASVEWTTPALTADQWYASDDIKDLVQEFVDRPGYTPGNYFGLRASDGTGYNLHRQIKTYNASASSGAKLEISYVTNTAPVANAGVDQTVYDNDIDMGEDVTLDGSSSTDAEGPIASYVWKDSYGNTIATGQSPSIFLTYGVHTITLEVTDGDGATDTDTVDITVQSPPQGTLTYAYGATNTNYQYRSLIITAKDGSNNDLWQMTVRVPLDGNTTTTHNYYEEGEIIGFKDLAYGGTPFEYSPEPGSASSSGMLSLNKLQGDFYDGSSASDHSWQTAQSYTFEKVYTLATGVTGVLTVQIDAPYLVGGATDYRTCIAADYTIDNQSGSDYDVRFSSGQQSAGTGALSLNYAGYNSWTLVNPDDSTAKPNFHLTDSTDGHQLYKIYDWFGSTATDEFIGFFGKFEVKDNSQTAALNMRPGMTFELISEGMDFGYNLTSDQTYGATNAGTSGVRSSITHQPRPFGFSWLANGNTASMDWFATISTQSYSITPLANAGPDQEVWDTGSDEVETISLNGSASSDADGSITSWVWYKDGVVIATGQTTTADLGLGEHTITLQVTDSAGLKDEDTLLVNVKFNGPFYVDQSHPNADDNNFGTETAPWRTIGQATGWAAAGQVVNIKEGVYRENVTVANSGTAGNPITFQAVNGDRVVLSGADEITGWSQLGSTSRNANHAEIHYVDLSYAPGKLYEDGEELVLGRTPNQGFWSPESGSSGTTEVVNANLNQTDSNYWVGARIFYFDRTPVNQFNRTIVSFDPATDKITADSSLVSTGGSIAINEDVFYLYNKLELIDQPGEWAVEDLGGGAWRVYLWPSDSQDPSTHEYEIPTNGNPLFYAAGRDHLVIDGLEIRHGKDIGFQSGSNGDYIELRNCIVHHNDYTAVKFDQATGGGVFNSLIYNNENGISVSGCADLVIEQNEIGPNEVDGIQVTGFLTRNQISEDITIRQNYLHDHFSLKHPDGVQTYNADGSTDKAVFDVLFDSNVILASGASMIFAEAQDMRFENNLIIGASNCFKGTGTDPVLLNNTIGYSTLSVAAYYELSQNAIAKNNIFFQGHDKQVVLFASVDGVSDYNIYYCGPNPNKVLAYDGTHYATLAGFQSGTGQDPNSQYTDPGFVNAPPFYLGGDGAKRHLYEADRIYVYGSNVDFAVNDYIEINFDGVQRTVTALGSDWVEFSPALPEIPLLPPFICNWKTNTNFAYDFRPAIGGAAEDGGEGGAHVGSLIDLQDYRQGDFDGDSVRDIPLKP